MPTVMIIIAYILSFLSLLLNLPLFIRIKPPYGWFLNMAQHATVLALALSGLVGAGLGWLYRAPIAVAAGLLGALISVIYIALVTVPQAGFERAFGKDWESRIPPERASADAQKALEPGLAAHGRAALGAGPALLDDPERRGGWRRRPQAVVRHLAAC